jgi:hypothetical protein
MWLCHDENQKHKFTHENNKTAKARLRACLKTTRGAVFGEKAVWQGATMENTPGGSSTEEQRRQTAFYAKTLRAAGLLSVARVGSVLTARVGDAPASPPRPQPKSLAAAPLVVFKHALKGARPVCFNGQLIGYTEKTFRELGAVAKQAIHPPAGLAAP